MIGTRLQDKYDVHRVIGQGGTGTVYAARHVESGLDVAIKWMHARAFAADDPDLLRFIQEARIAGKLDSLHVARVLELERDPDSGVPFQVMELLQGEDAGALLKRVGPLRPDVAMRIAAQACAGLSAAHAVGVLHRDIKPENLYLARMKDGSLVVKLLDFGVAKIRRTMSAGASMGLTAPQESITKSGELVGTPLFMAPEQLDGMKNVDRQGDVYSMGVTMYALCTGAPPHAEMTSFIQLLHAVVNLPAPSLSEVAPWVPAGVAKIIEKAMAKNKADRYPDAAALLEALGPWIRGGTNLSAEMLVPVDKSAPPMMPDIAPFSEPASTLPAPVLHTPESPEEPKRLSGKIAAFGLLFVVVLVVVAWSFIR